MSQIEATAGLVGEALMDLEMNGRVWDTAGSRHASMAPHGIYPSAGEDRWVAISCAGDGEWRGLLRAVGGPAWAGAPRFASHSGRQANARELAARSRAGLATSRPKRRRCAARPTASPPRR